MIVLIICESVNVVVVSKVKDHDVDLVFVDELDVKKLEEQTSCLRKMFQLDKVLLPDEVASDPIIGYILHEDVFSYDKWMPAEDQLKYMQPTPLTENLPLEYFEVGGGKDEYTDADIDGCREEWSS
ncbi:hypothetical protein QVD17_04917 [Tagetes erecta]|uniref:Uncharacterized protein n=1 Tax=Tagetes erecta TaxID=13708 RepID=A0AAD8LCU3_TARER|nr:hypothetical protein QVD17_04917 [Tagetes erecta]